MIGQHQLAPRPLEESPFVAKLKRSAKLDDNDVIALSRLLGKTHSVDKGKDIIVEGYEYKELNIVAGGLAIRYKLLHQGARQIINLVIPGDIIGFPSSFFARAVFSVMAATKMSLHRVPLDAFRDLCQKRANIATALIWFAARETAIYAEHVIDAGRRAPLERLAHFLLETHMRLKAVGHASEDSFELLVSQESIGDAVGLSAPHVNRMLRELKSEGLIETKGRQIRIIDMAALQILGEFQSGYLMNSWVPEREETTLLDRVASWSAKAP
jgi:CRP-like cAMP-binding protein